MPMGDVREKRIEGRPRDDPLGKIPRLVEVARGRDVQ